MHSTFGSFHVFHFENLAANLNGILMITAQAFHIFFDCSIAYPKDIRKIRHLVSWVLQILRNEHKACSDDMLNSDCRMNIYLLRLLEKHGKKTSVASMDRQI